MRHARPARSAPGSRAGARAARIIGRRSKPSIRMPLSSFIAKSPGRPCAPCRARAASRRRRRAAPRAPRGRRSNSRNPNQPQSLPLVLVEGVVDLGADPADHPPVAAGEEVLGFAMAEEGVHAAVEEHPALELQRGHPQRVFAVQVERELDEALQVAPARDRRERSTLPIGSGTYTSPMSETATGPGRRLREGPQPRPARAARSGQGARPAPLLPPAHLAGRAGRGDGGRAGRSCSAPTTTWA